ncbi:hypothetical protein Z043_115255 [Scleropages formosus]|uniref:RGS domain-containing protein n=1 Tax=Scleropages formosus TaxID=113540 RepID=A0A0N8JYD9_SCLFO|nr:hypothetical protein Z043_115255 [Scleropages formosus]
MDVTAGRVLSTAHGFRADGDAQAAAGVAAGGFRRWGCSTDLRESSLKCLLLLLVLLLQLFLLVSTNYIIHYAAVSPLGTMRGMMGVVKPPVIPRLREAMSGRTVCFDRSKPLGSYLCHLHPLGSPRPSVEEVRSWGQSFDKLMKCPAGRKAFREFLRTEFSEENMLFWLACEDLRQETNKSAIEEKAGLIYEDYISILSPKEVSLDARVREAINRGMLEPTCHTFDDAQLQIYTLMQRDSYPRFMNSPAYKTILQTLSEQSPES